MTYYNSLTMSIDLAGKLARKKRKGEDMTVIFENF